VRAVIHSTCQRNVFMASIQRCANIHLVLEYMCVYTSIYSHVLCYCEQDTVVIVPPYPYCIKEDRLDVALEDCWYARPQLFFKCYLRPKHGRLHTKQDQIYTSIYVYILVCTCLTISYQMICCANSSLDVASHVWVVCQLRPLKKGGMLTWLKATSVVLRPVGGARQIERNSK
jgi:hypothetical protein